MYKYCPYCSNILNLQKNGQKKRLFCTKCNKYIYCHTPQTAACIVLSKENMILLVKRKNDPFKELWSLPAGFVEYGENPRDAAIRELNEEIGLKAKYDRVVGVYLADDHPKTFSILTVTKVKEVKGKLKPADDASEAEYFDPKSLPKMAFKTQVKAIEDCLNLPNA